MGSPTSRCWTAALSHSRSSTTSRNHRPGCPSQCTRTSIGARAELAHPLEHTQNIPIPRPPFQSQLGLQCLLYHHGIAQLSSECVCCFCVAKLKSILVLLALLHSDCEQVSGLMCALMLASGHTHTHTHVQSLLQAL